MSRQDWGLAGLNLWLLVAGGGVLYGLGLVRSAGAAFRLAGVAYVTGWALVGIGATVLLVLGFALTEGQVLALALALAGGGALLRLRVPAATEPRPSWSRAQRLGVLAAAPLVAYLALMVRDARVAVISAWDAWAFWLPKAQSLVYFDGLDTRAGGFTSFEHPHYPPLAPAQEAIAFRFMDAVDPLALPLQHWIVACAFFAALAGLLAGRVPPIVLWPSLTMLAFAPALTGLVGSSLADEPLALLFALAGVTGALWLLDGDARLAALTAIFLAAAALTKNEGVLLALVLVAALAAASYGRLRERARVLAGLAAAPVAAVVPWKLWLELHDVRVSPPYSLGDLARPGYLVERLDRLRVVLEELPGYVFSSDQWLYVVPLALVAAALAARGVPRLTALTVATAGAIFVALVAVYWIGTPDVHWYIDTSAARAVAPGVLFLGALFPLLVAEAAREPDGA